MSRNLVQEKRHLGGEEARKQEGQLQGRDGARRSSVSGKGNASGLGVGGI